MKISVTPLTGGSFWIEVRDAATVDELKVAIANSHQIGIDQIKLLFNAKALTSGTLCQYGIRNGGQIHMVVSDPVSIRVTFQLPSGTTVSMDVEPSEQVKMFKQKIQNTYNLRVEHIELVYEGRFLKEGRLDQYNIRDGSKLELRLKTFSITVTTVDHKRIEMEISHADTVDSLKTRLRTETRVLEEQQRLICRGKELSTGLLSNYGICSGEVINMVGRTRGG